MHIVDGNKRIVIQSPQIQQKKKKAVIVIALACELQSQHMVTEVTACQSRTAYCL